MSATQHTPGPWSVGCFDDIFAECQDDGEDPIATINERSKYNPEFALEAEANARLIAAAPDLLAALQLMILNAETALKYQDSERNDSAAAARLANILHWPGFKDAHAALAKVKGAP